MILIFQFLKLELKEQYYKHFFVKQNQQFTIIYK